VATRKKPEDTRWLAGWHGIPGSDTVALDALDGEYTMHQSLMALTQLRYLIRISGCLGAYQVQCIAVKDTPYHLKEPIGLSYAGADLRKVLSAAAYEADLIAVSGGEAEYRLGERARWVHG